MVEAKFDTSFTGLTNATIAVTNQEIPIDPTELLGNNVKYTVNAICCS